jgi:hypothetical protein
MERRSPATFVAHDDPRAHSRSRRNGIGVRGEEPLLGGSSASAQQIPISQTRWRGRQRRIPMMVGVSPRPLALAIKEGRSPATFVAHDDPRAHSRSRRNGIGVRGEEPLLGGSSASAQQIPISQTRWRGRQRKNYDDG